MVSDELPGRLEALVDYLRVHKDRQTSLTEVAAVTEVLIATMSGYFKSIDTSIYNEFRDLSEYIENARHEIAALAPSDIKTSRIPRAGRELDAIVQATEEATHTIMEAAERMMAADPADAEAYQTTVSEGVMQIFEACSFQDITGQRISKVVETLSVIEARLHALGEVWGVEHMPPDVDQAGNEKRLMSGPALAGEGIDQNEVDALMSHGGEASREADLEAEDGDRWGLGQPDPIFENDAPRSLDVLEESAEAEETAKAEETAEAEETASHEETAEYDSRPSSASEIGLSPEDVERLITGDRALEPANDLDAMGHGAATLDLGEDDDAHDDAVTPFEARTANGSAATRNACAGEDDLVLDDDDDDSFEPVEARGASSDRAKKAAAPSGKTTQADIDALFS